MMFNDKFQPKYAKVQNVIFFIKFSTLFQENFLEIPRIKTFIIFLPNPQNLSHADPHANLSSLATTEKKENNALKKDKRLSEPEKYTFRADD